MDISKYFYSIDHNILKNLIKEYLSLDEYNLICKVIDSTNKEYINKTIDKYNIDIPYYEYDKGLPIGNMTSQFLSIFYLYKLDHYIVHNLKCKYYIRYMDDFLIIDSDLNKLKEVKDKIIAILEKDYLLKINNKKTMITKAKDGFSFLGYTFKVLNNKTIIKIKQSNYLKVKNRIKYTKYLLDNNLISYNSAFCTIMTYTYGYKYASNNRILKFMDNYFYEK